MAKTNWKMDDTVKPEDLNQIGQEINELRADGSATDDRIGERTISDTTAPTSNTGKLTGLFSGLANMIKSITGGATWRTAPGMTIAAIKTILDAATNLATANTMIKRDANGRAKVAVPSATDDIARKAEVDAAILTAANDATNKANAAQSAAITTSASDAASKTNAVQTNLNTHANNSTVHITATERTSWNAKETTTGSKAKADAAQAAAISAAATDASTKANAVQANLTSHANDNTKHITAAERTAWNAKADADSVTPKMNIYSNRLVKVNAPLAAYLNPSPTATGIIKITLPTSWNNTFVGLKVRGQVLTSMGMFELLLHGYNQMSGTQWSNTRAVLTGVAPFDIVRFGHDGTRCCILLGKTNTVWAYPQIVLEEALLGWDGSDASAKSQWTISLITSETGITANQQPTINAGLTFDSPNFTGSPTVPTLSTGTKTDQIASTRFVDNNFVAKTINISPDTDLNTITESGFYRFTNNVVNGPAGANVAYSQMIVSRGQDTIFQMIVHYSSTRAFIRSGIVKSTGDTWQPWKEMTYLDSPAFTGTPTAPTPANTSNDTSISTTAWARARMNDALNAAKDYAVNGVASGSTSVDPNTTTESMILTSHANGPVSGSLYFILTEFWSSREGNRSQMAISYYSNSPRMFVRTYYSGTWYPWREFAPLDSPNFTGNVRVPTAAAGTNDTTAANTSFVNKAILDASKSEYIGIGEDLNNYTTEGSYYCGTNTVVANIANTPENLAFHLRVDKHAGVVQTFTTYEAGSPRVYKRNYYNSWGAWKRVAYTDQLPTVASYAQAIAGTDDTTMMTPKKTIQSVDSRNLYGTTGGTATAYTLNFTVAPEQYYTGMPIRMKLHTATGTNPTLNVNSLGARALYAADGTSRFVGVTGRIYTFVYDGTNFILASGGGWSIYDTIPSINAVAKLKDTFVWQTSNNGINTTFVFVDSKDGVWYGINPVGGASALRKLNTAGSLVLEVNGSSICYSIAEDSAGNYIVGFDNEIRKINASGGQVWSKVGSFSSSAYGAIKTAQAIVMDSSNNSYIALWGTTTGGAGLMRLSSTGSESWGKTDVTGHSDIAIATNNTLYHAYGNSIRRLNLSGTIAWTKTATGVESVITDELGFVYWINSSNLVTKWDSDGNVVWTFNVGHTFGTSQSLSWDKNGILWCTTSTSASTPPRLLAFALTKEGELVFGSLVEWQSGRATDSAGDLYVSSYSSTRAVRKYSKNVSGSIILS